jgi:hypothetical protein
VSSSATPPTIRGTGVLTSPHTESSSLVTSSSMTGFPLLFFPRLSHRARRVPRSCPCVPYCRTTLPCSFVHRATSRSPTCDAFPRTASCGLGVPCIASHDPTGATLHRTASCGLGVPCVASRDPTGTTLPRTATCGLGVPSVVTYGPVISLHQPHPDIPAPRSWRCTGSPSRRASGLSPHHHPPGSSAHPPDGHPARDGCPLGP